MTNNPLPDDGDRDSARVFERFFKAHHEPLFRRLMRHLRNREDARDMVQETFAKLLEVDRIKLIQQPIAYLFKAAQRAHRKLSIRKQLEQITYSSEAADHASEKPQDVAQNELLDEIEAECQLMRAICELTPAHQDVIAHYISGMSIPDIAERLNLSPHTVRKYVTEANAKIRMICAPPASSEE